MPRDLFIVRHAQTDSGQHNNSDKERELKPEGITQATQLGKYLKASDYHVDLIMASDAARAKATATLIAQEINYPEYHIQYDEKIYFGAMDDLLAMIKKTSNSVNHLLMVGHCPTLIELNNYLSDSQKSSMETCELTLINIKATWSELVAGAGELKLNYRPSY